MTIAQRTLLFIGIAIMACCLLIGAPIMGLALWLSATLALAAVLGGAWYFWSGVVEPIRELQEAIEAQTTKMDFNKSLNIQAEGEIARIAHAYNGLLQKLRVSFENIQQVASHLNQTVEEADIAAKRIARNTQLQSDASQNMNDSIDEMVAGISKVTEQTQEAQQHTRETREIAEEGTKDILSTVNGMQAISNTVDKAALSIKALRDDCNSISNMAVVIHQIADQTNLLALNAAIEAARAGDQGRGFAVVADEVRGLAQRTAQSTQEISNLVLRMQDSAETAVESMTVTETEVRNGVENAQKAGASINKINDGSITAARIVANIFESIQEQQSASTEISKKIEQISQMGEQNSVASSASAKSVSEISTATRAIMHSLSGFHFGTQSAVIELRVADQHGEDHPAVRALHFMREEIARQTNGRIRLKVCAGGMLGNDFEVFEQLQRGGIDMMRSNPAVLSKAVPETNLLALPFLFRDIRHMHKVVDGTAGARILAACNKAGLQGLCFYDSGARSIYANKPIRSVTDMRGMKLRVMPSDMWASVARAMGAEPVKLGMDELISAQKMGVIDAAENNIPTFDTYKQHQVFRYFSHTEHAIVPEIISFSKKRWDQLSAEDQRIIAGAARDSVIKMREFWFQSEDKALKNSLKAGVNFIKDVNKNSFVNAMQPVYRTLVNTPELQSLLKEIQDV